MHAALPRCTALQRERAAFGGTAACPRARVGPRSELADRVKNASPAAPVVSTASGTNDLIDSTFKPVLNTHKVTRFVFQSTVSRKHRNSFFHRALVL